MIEDVCTSVLIMPRMMKLPPENHQVGSTGRTQLLLTLETFHFLWVKGPENLRNTSMRKAGCKAHTIHILYPDYNVANS